ncbi:MULTISPECIES: heavy metal translocating P-type ATPase [unclassified Ruegeria]|uniref:heavy metal translocating P-type ATPase n=1 Tax=unclassified Ruegeria TaxID=2625375 RepID=UPI001489DA8D|nr:MULTISPECIES: heavy metal translocating P-type ATPase [unclassified Ruegeria]NOD49103.1 cadmium-translocating P-type ATPase [Ruegeria sp. HKCCD5849]NOD51667.1 cadmium-translocating P-type ATPase [Ruegeria sp. HKCCD5851]NOD68653.1 cadmium-translocating P-type ATPase [Ruegeria sp. HKCCD7303]NOE34929.1 cadmium-translocating P-type ATPase [Ruegeria sp. HKCCD7318]
MTAQLSSGTAACPGCLAAPAEPARSIPEDVQIALSLPGIHCSACIATVERELNAHPGVENARVNLTLKRAMIKATPETRAVDLIPVLEKAGFEAHELDPGALSATQTDKAGRDLLMRLAVAGFASMNVMLLSVSVWSGATDATRDMFHWISAAIALPAIAFSAQPFFANAWSALRVRRLNMDVPIVLAILLALVTSLWETALSGEHAYFDAALTLTFFLLAGRYLDYRTRAAARSAAEELTALEVPRAIRLVDGVENEIAVADLKVGDLILVRPGGRMPVDGEIVSGQSELDRSLLTGETVPVFAEIGQLVSAGEVNLTGPLTLRATAVGEDTSLHRMADLVAIAESGRSRYTSLADKAAKLYAPGVHILSALSFLGWYIYSGDIRTALNIAAAVLIITCPCALGLAVPAVTTAASGRLFRKGMLIKHATALERLSEADTVVFDKTGTLTSGSPELVNLGDHSRAKVEVALALAEASAHPLSVALAKAAREAGIKPANVRGVVEVPGYGTEGEYRGQRVRLGRAAWVGAEQGSETSAWLAIGDHAPLAFRFSDALRPGAAEAVDALRAAGKHVVLMSGDSQGAVRALAEKLGITDWIAEALPQDKAHRIQDLSDKGHHVLMVGDGLNDTAALAAAHVSISPASALDAARVASDIVLLGNDLSPIADACDTAVKATKRIRENFRIATVYNVIAVPLAVIGLATPLIAALAMSTSSITVSLNALRLR